MKFRIRSVSVSCSTTSSRKGEAEDRGYRAQLPDIAARQAGVGIDHYQREHGGERRDRDIGNRPGGKPLQQEHEQRKTIRKWKRSANCVPSAPRYPRSWSRLSVAASSSSAASSSAPKRSGMSPDPLRDHLKELDHADHHQRDACQEDEQAERLSHRVLAAELGRCGRVSCSWTPSPAMNSSSGTTASVPSRKVTMTSCRDSGLREIKNHPQTTEGIMAIPAACRKFIAVTCRDAPLTITHGARTGLAVLVVRSGPTLEWPTKPAVAARREGMLRDFGYPEQHRSRGPRPCPACQLAGPSRVIVMSENVDAARVRDCLAGDPQAFAALVGLYEKPVYNVALCACCATPKTRETSPRQCS